METLYQISRKACRGVVVWWALPLVRFEYRCLFAFFGCEAAVVTPDRQNQEGGSAEFTMLQELNPLAPPPQNPGTTTTTTIIEVWMFGDGVCDMQARMHCQRSASTSHANSGNMPPAFFLCSFLWLFPPNNNDVGPYIIDCNLAISNLKRKVEPIRSTRPGQTMSSKTFSPLLFLEFLVVD